jgi:zinc protease
MDDLKAWLAPHLADAPLEVTIVGDVDVDAVIAACARTFGALPERRAPERFDARREVPALRTAWHPRFEIATTVPKSLVLAVFRATDGIEAARRRRLHFLSQVLNDRLRVEIREKLGATYSPGASLDVSQVYPGDGKILIQAMSEPDKADELLEACFAVTDSLAKDGVTAEEVSRLREPILNQIRDMRRQNGYWQQVLDQAQSDPSSLANATSLDGFYETVTAEQLSELAAEYLARERASSVIVAPEGMGKKPEAEAESESDPSTPR